MASHLLAAVALAVGLGAASVAGAASFGLSGGEAYLLPADFDPAPGSPGIGPGIGTEVRRNATLSLDGPARVTFSYAGTEAGYDNRFLLDGVERFGNKTGGGPVTLDFGSGTMPFSFRDPVGSVANGASAGYAGSLALFRKSATVVYALFNDSAAVDHDYDDMLVRMEIAPVPLPAAAWLLLAGLGSLGALARRRRAMA